MNPYLGIALLLTTASMLAYVNSFSNVQQMPVETFAAGSSFGLMILFSTLIYFETELKLNNFSFTACIPWIITFYCIILGLFAIFIIATSPEGISLLAGTRLLFPLSLLVVTLHAWGAYSSADLTVHSVAKSIDALPDDTPEPSKQQDTLVIVVHGFGGPQSVKAMAQEISNTYDADVLCIDYLKEVTSRGPYLLYETSNLDAYMLTAQLAKSIEEQVSSMGKEYDNLILIGHSVGCDLLLKSFLFANKYTSDLEFNGMDFEKYKAISYKWTNKVSKMVLLSYLSGGYDLTQDKAQDKSYLIHYLTWFSRYVGDLTDCGRLLGKFEAGTPFIVNLQNDWVSFFKNHKDHPAFNIYHVVGEIDEITAGSEPLALKAATIADDVNFFTVEMKGTGHGETPKIVFEETAIWKTTEADTGKIDSENSENELPRQEELLCRHRRAKLFSILEDGNVIEEQETPIVQNVQRYTNPSSSKALKITSYDQQIIENSKSRLFAETTLKDMLVKDSEDDQENAPDKDTILDKDIKHVVIVLHGIRDFGRWGAALNDLIEDETTKVVTPRYGYFGMGSFLLGSQRKQYVRWFANQVALTAARYPNAELSFIGHSNGTFLFAQAFEDYPSMHFRNIIFAGSVVNSQYDWKTIGMSNNHGNEVKRRYKKALNIKADQDAVVAVCPRIYEVLPDEIDSMFSNKNVGSAGYVGFSKEMVDNDYVQEVRIQGGHSAFQDIIQPIAKFIKTNDHSNYTLKQFNTDICIQASKSNSYGWHWIVSPLFFILIISLLILLSVFFVSPARQYIFQSYILVIVFLIWIMQKL